MDVERTISDIELLERIYAAPDTRPPSDADHIAANQRHDYKCASNPWFRLWQDFGLPR